jgi:hypothetical protein
MKRWKAEAEEDFTLEPSGRLRLSPAWAAGGGGAQIATRVISIPRWVA